MAREATLEELEREVQDLKRDFDVRFTDLQTRLMAVEKKVDDDKKELQAELKTVRTMVGEVKSNVAALESLEDANFMSITHMLGVIARKLNIPKRDLKTGDRRGTSRD